MLEIYLQISASIFHHFRSRDWQIVETIAKAMAWFYISILFCSGVPNGSP